MRNYFFLLALTTVLLSSSDCNSKKEQRYKGKLEIAGICMNYTIGVTEGNIDTALVETAWTDENTGKSYEKVFRLGNPCTFPSTLRQGDEFYFTIDTTRQKDCIVCMAYYPTPVKALAIKVEQ